MSNYYDVLGVSRSASDAQIKAAYRARAKELHPDVNQEKYATREFQALQAAFSVLGSPERKRLYDEGNFKAAVDPATKATEAEFDPVRCDACNCISAQLRFVQYDRVISYIFGSSHIRPAGVFCPTCTSKRLFASTLLTGSIGWLSLGGFFYSTAGVIRNLRGGVRLPGANAFILAKQSAYFLQQGQNDLAQALARESLDYYKRMGLLDPDFALATSGADFARKILSGQPTSFIRLRSKWSGWPVPGRYALAGFIVPALIWATILNSGSSNHTLSNISDSYVRLAPVRTKGTAVPEPEIDVVGNDGYTYRVSNADYLILKPISDELKSRKSALRFRINALDQLNGRIERSRSTLDETNNDAITAFNQEIGIWNRERSQLESELYSYKLAIERFNADLARFGRKIR